VELIVGLLAGRDRMIPARHHQDLATTDTLPR
jgi:hypothetical protein